MKLFYGSSYDRGINHLLKMWPSIIEKYPDAELEICYGWDLYDKAYNDNPERQMWKKKMVKLMKQKGITEHGRLSKEKLAKIRRQCDIWAYPTDFCVTGDTVVDMPRDYMKYPLGVPIKDLVGQKPLIWTFNEDNGEFQLKKVEWVKKTRENAEIIKLNWDDGTNLKCTPDHKVLTYNRDWVKAKDLKKGESVVALKKHMKIQVSVGRSSWPTEHREVAIEKFGEIPKGHHVDHIDGNPFNNLPDNLQILSPKEHAKKTFTGLPRTKQSTKKRADSWRKWSETTEGKKHLSENGKKRAHKFWDGMTEEERKAFIEKRNTKRATGSKKWWDLLPEEKKKTWGDKGRKTRWNHKLVSIEKVDNEDVYDMKVKDNYNFIAGRVVIHNCETNCITAMDCQKDGVVPVVMNKAGLRESVVSGVRIEGDIYDKETREEYLEKLLELMGDKDMLQREREKGKKLMEEKTWDKIARLWSKYF